MIPATVCGCGANLYIWSSIVPQVSSLLNDRLGFKTTLKALLYYLWLSYGKLMMPETLQLISKKSKKAVKSAAFFCYLRKKNIEVIDQIMQHI